MSFPDIASAIERVKAVLRRRPDAAMHDDPPATARWSGGMRVVSHHANGSRVDTDMPLELGGTGDQVSPGWLLRAGLAACTTTLVAMGAAARGVELTELEAIATSRSDARGALGMTDADGQPVDPAPRDLQLLVRIAGHATPEALRSLVEQAWRDSPVARAIDGQARGLRLRVEVMSSR